jgi:hypothetical protein
VTPAPTAPGGAAAGAPAAATAVAAPSTAASAHAAEEGEEAEGDDESADLPSVLPAAPPKKADATQGTAEVAPATASAAPDWRNAPAKRRSGFTVGLAGGLALGSASGYPNSVEKIGFERYYTETGVAVGTGGFLWLGGALTDYLVFGVGAGGTNLGTADHTVASAGFFFHIEAFPLLTLGGRLQDIGVNLDTGAAVAYTSAKATGDDKVIDGALPAKIGGGVFWEGFRFWKLATGPWLYADYVWSTSVRQGGVYLGWRAALYAKP